MLDILSKIFDYIFPPHHTIVKIKHENPDTFLRFLHINQYKECVVLAEYQNVFVNSAIKANKFHHSHHAGLLLAGLIENWLKTLPAKPTILIPMPLSQKREKERGYNQVLEIIKYLENKTDTSIEKEILIKTKDTPPQSKMNREERLKNVADAFSFISNRKAISDVRVILIDDVITTGATMKSATTILKKNLPKGCELVCLAIAH